MRRGVARLPARARFLRADRPLAPLAAAAPQAAARSAAGDYDVERVRGRLEDLINTTDILMLSFPT